MATNNVNGTTYSGYIPTDPDAGKRVPKQQLGKNEFLQILAVQMANQDPLEPTSDTEFIAQMAQFSSLEQMQEMNQTMNNNKAYSMIGKDIFADIKDAYGVTQSIYGNVAGVVNSGGKDYLLVGSYKVPVESVTYVYDNGNNQQGLMAQAANLIGKNITAEVATNRKDDKGNYITEKVVGEVEYILVKDGRMFAKIKGSDKEVMIADIIRIEDKPVAPTPTPEEPGEEGEAGETP